MATAWVRSLSCKSNAVAADVYNPPLPKKQPPPVSLATNDVALLPAKERPRSVEQDPPARTKHATSKPRKKTKPAQAQLTASPARPSSAFLTMMELPEGHSSRRVVELIFASGWGRAVAAEVEALFRVHSTARAVARFEDARAAARARCAADADARCAADGNEMMRFQCRAAEAGGEVICTAEASGPRQVVGLGDFPSAMKADLLLSLIYMPPRVILDAMKATRADSRSRAD